MAQRSHVLITGSPGVGKTTLVTKLNKVLSDKGLNVAGFYTEEVRERGTRIGFDVVTLNGQRAVLARVKLDKPSNVHVGKYTVDVGSFESTALDVLQTKCDVMIIDEIGKMELFSTDFQNAVRKAFHGGQATIIATIPITKSKVLILEDVKSRSDTSLFTVTQSNREQLVNTIIDYVLGHR